MKPGDKVIVLGTGHGVIKKKDREFWLVEWKEPSGQRFKANVREVDLKLDTKK
mgnify:CR=1 FL=1